MIKHTLQVAVAAAIFAVAGAAPAEAGNPYYAYTDAWAAQAAATYPWHGAYYHQEYGAPVALVVPPTSHMRQTYSWGVSQNLMYPIHHQFGRPATPPGYGAFLPTPPWPSHTDQFGVYYVRGPW